MHWKSLEHIVEPIILGSGSPRRKELFKRLFENFTVMSTDEELSQQCGDAVDFVMRNALFKAGRIYENHSETVKNGSLFTFDTVVTYENKILGKPCDLDEARSMLIELRAKSHQVVTSYCLFDFSKGAVILNSYSSTTVKFRDYSDSELDDYLRCQESLDKAGAYGIQGYGSMLVERIEGCYFNVVGLPVVALFQDLQKIVT